MNNSWNVIGWLILGFATLALIRAGLLFSYKLIVDWFNYRRTKDTPPQAGQIWQGRAGHKYFIISTNMARITTSTYNPAWSRGVSTAAWSDSWNEWHRKIRERWLCLVGVWNTEEGRSEEDV